MMPPHRSLLSPMLPPSYSLSMSQYPLSPFSQWVYAHRDRRPQNAYVVILPRLCYDPHRIVCHRPASLNAVVCLCLSCFYTVPSAASIFYRYQISTSVILISNPPSHLHLPLIHCVSAATIISPLSSILYMFIAAVLHILPSSQSSAVIPPPCNTWT